MLASFKGSGDVSVVIPTLGGDTLLKTLKTLSKQTYLPTSVYLCYPNVASVSGEIHSRKYPFHLVLINADIKGQVGQRAIGFQAATTTYTLQLDDDICLPSGAIESLVKTLLLVGPRNVVGPIIVSENRLKRCPLNFLSNLIDMMFFFLPWGRRKLGYFTTHCTGYPVIASCVKSSEKYLSVKWLPGGCVLGYTDELIKINFYPFAGKAFGEDCLHSWLRGNAGLSHIVVPSLLVKTVLSEEKFRLREFMEETEKLYYLTKIMNGSKIRFGIGRGYCCVRTLFSIAAKRVIYSTVG